MAINKTNIQNNAHAAPAQAYTLNNFNEAMQNAAQDTPFKNETLDDLAQQYAPSQTATMQRLAAFQEKMQAGAPVVEDRPRTAALANYTAPNVMGENNKKDMPEISNSPIQLEGDPVDGQLKGIFDKYAGGAQTLNYQESLRMGLYGFGSTNGKNYDTNKDGYLDFEEFKAHATNMCDNADWLQGNQNGKIDQAELDRFITSASQREAEGQGTTTEAQDINRPKFLEGFENYQFDEDGLIVSAFDMRQMLKQVTRPNTDNNGDNSTIDRDEWNYFVQETGYNKTSFSDEAQNSAEGKSEYVSLNFADKLVGSAGYLTQNEFFALFPNLAYKK